MGENNNGFYSAGKAAVLVCSCDKYEDVWYPFFSLFKKNWQDCPYDIFLNTESKDFAFEGLNIKCVSPYKNLSPKKIAKIPYGKRMIDFLSMIECEYVIVLLDDYFLRKKVDTEMINNVISWMEKDKSIACFSTRYSYSEDDKLSSEYSDFKLSAKISDFKQNLMAAIWRKEVFVSSWRKYESPWEWEAYGSIRTFKSDLKYYFSGYKRKYYPLFDYYDPETPTNYGITMGKWTPHAVATLNSNGIKIDYTVRGVLDATNDQITASKYSGKNFIQKILIAFSPKSLFSLFRSAGFIWGIRYIRWKIYLFRHKREEALYFIQWYNKRKNH